jgi:hypothetical protein
LLHDQIEDLVAEHALEERMPAYGVAQKVIHGGYDLLSPNQRWVFDTYDAPPFSDAKKSFDFWRS